MKRKAAALLFALAVVSLGANSSGAAIWQSTGASLLYGTKNQTFDTEGRAIDQDRTIITFEHANGWMYGDNFFFFDMIQPFDVNSGFYGEWHPRLSWGKIANSSVGFGPVKDVLLATEINVDSGWRAYLYGIGFDLDLPHFSFFAINFFIRDDMTIDDASTWQISPSWKIPFKLSGARFEFGGFIDIAGAEGTGKSQLLTQPQLLLDLGNFSDKPGNVYVGIEYQYWQNKYGIKDFDENYVQMMGKWVF